MKKKQPLQEPNPLSRLWKTLSLSVHSGVWWLARTLSANQRLMHALASTLERRGRLLMGTN
jgi:hypothetical protein